VRQHLGSAGEPLALALEALDRARYGGDAPLPRAEMRRWWSGFARTAAAGSSSSGRGR